MPNYLFNAGNSAKGPIGFCAKVVADTEEAAIVRLTEFLESINCECTVFVNEHSDVEFLDVYFNPEAIMRDVDIDVEAEGFALQNETSKPTPERLLVPPAKAKQLLLRGLNDCRGQQNLFPDMDVA